ncbi:MAG TPA: hypothetical protein VFT79_12130 [Solirubrobacterales bacterium]|nr:hypothetical protein [Solirubrobacterales bacterium]
MRLPGEDAELLGIDRDGERAAGELAARAWIGPVVVAMLGDPPCLVTEFVAGKPMRPEELREPEALAEVAAALRTLHACEERLPTTFSSGTAFGNHDREWMHRHLPRYDEVHIHDVTSQWACFGVWRPGAREALQPLTPQDLATKPSRTLPCARRRSATCRCGCCG